MLYPFFIPHDVQICPQALPSLPAMASPVVHDVTFGGRKWTGFGDASRDRGAIVRSGVGPDSLHDRTSSSRVRSQRERGIPRSDEPRPKHRSRRVNAQTRRTSGSRVSIVGLRQMVSTLVAIYAIVVATYPRYADYRKLANRIRSVDGLSTPAPQGRRPGHRFHDDVPLGVPGGPDE